MLCPLMKQTALAAVLMVALLTSTLAAAFLFPCASAASNDVAPILSMPTEHVNYTIIDVNDSFWAKIDGDYPITVQGGDGELPMVYPMPPNSTNIHVTLNGSELAWSNYTEAYPWMRHKTAIGEWWIISSTLENFSDSFDLNIHYEHPVERVNGSYMFLYDLNILDYLSAQNPDSTAYFRIQFDSAVRNVHVYTAPVDSMASQWQPKNFTQTTEGDLQVVSVEMDSRYGEVLPGDLVVVFDDGGNGVADGFPVWVPITIDVALVSIVLYLKRKALASALTSRKTSNQSRIRV